MWLELYTLLTTLAKLLLLESVESFVLFPQVCCTGIYRGDKKLMSAADWWRKEHSPTGCNLSAGNCNERWSAQVWRFWEGKVTTRNARPDEQSKDGERALWPWFIEPWCILRYTLHRWGLWSLTLTSYLAFAINFWMRIEISVLGEDSSQFKRIHLISTSLNPPKGRKKEERNWICLNERDDGGTSQEYEGDLHALEQICREVVAHVITTAPMSDITAVPTTGDPYAEPR